ncbi:MAG: hypothetical protein M3Q14_00625 [bacterium]|nr:hypothetical protein [bacterium]
MDGPVRGIVVVALIILFIGAAFTGFSWRRRPVIEQQVANNDVQTPLESECKLIDNKRFCSADYIDLSEQAATEKAQADGLTARVVENDENPNIAITDDYQPKRINFFIKEKIVYQAKFY